MNERVDNLGLEAQKSIASWAGVLEFMALSEGNRVLRAKGLHEPTMHLANAARGNGSENSGAANIVPLIERWVAINNSPELTDNNHERHRAGVATLTLRQAAMVSGGNTINPHLRMAHELKHVNTDPSDYPWLRALEPLIHDKLHELVENPTAFKDQQFIPQVLIHLHHLLMIELDQHFPSSRESMAS